MLNQGIFYHIKHWGISSQALIFAPPYIWWYNIPHQYLPFWSVQFKSWTRSTSRHQNQTERIVSHQNIIVDDSRTCMSTDTINAWLTIARPHYDPRPAVVRFLSMKPRRGGPPGPTVYAQHDFAKKFCRQSIVNDHIDDIGHLGLLFETVWCEMPWPY